ncbi:MAG: hypothetical protein IJQ31_01820 [Thermoguttaceae bacterium]|nr:hypothetical protein [Thermoguttaceae bacterium]
MTFKFKIQGGGNLAKPLSAFISGFSIFSLILAASGAVQAATINWTGGTDSKWSTASNWSSGALPVAGDTVQVGTAYQTYTNILTIQDGDSATVGRADFSGGEMKMTGGTMTVSSDRLRVGGAASTTLGISGGTMTLNGGFGLGGKTDASLTSTLNVSDSARMVVSNCFLVHGNNNSNLNQTGGIILNKSGWSQVGEGPSPAIVNLTGGAFYNTSASATFYVGRNNGSGASANAGTGTITVDGGQFYVANKVLIGNRKDSEEAGKLGKIVLNSGILSIKSLEFDKQQAEVQLNGGTFITSSVASYDTTKTANLTNAGSTIEIANAFAPTEDQINGLAASETWYSKYQKGTVGTLTVSGTYAQTAGTIVVDITNGTTYDKLTAGSFNITGGDLNIQLNAQAITTETTFKFFGDNPVGTLNFDKILENGSSTTRWKVEEGGAYVRLASETFKWNGSASGDWNNRANWNANGSNYVPDVLDEVQVGSSHNAYTNELTIKDGDSLEAKIMYFNGGKMSVTGGELSVASGRWRIGNTGSANSEVNISGGTVNMKAGLGLGGNGSSSVSSTLNVSGSARVNVSGECFIVHGNSTSTLNQSGGVIVNTSTWNQVGEGANPATVNLTGGAFYNTANAYFFVGRNGDGNNAGKGLITVSGGQFYTAGTLQLGNKKDSDQEGRYGRVVLNSGILSARRLTFDVRQGELQLKGGTLVTSEVNRSLTNSGSTIEITNAFAPTEAQINGLAANETWFSKYQKGKVGTLAVSGTYAQTSGTVVIDITNETTYDKLTAGSFNVTGGDLSVNVNVTGINKEMAYAVFGSNPSGNLNFSRIIVNGSEASRWKIMEDGKLVRLYEETFKWTGSESGDWNTRANWGSNNSSYAPESLDTVQVGTFYNAYTNDLTIKDGDDVQAKIMYLNGGKMSVTGGTLSVVSDRLRVGNEGTASNEIVFSGGTTNFKGGLGVGGGSTTTAKTNTLTVTGDARVNIGSVFVLHGYSPSTLTQEGGVIFNNNTSSGGQFTQIGEGANEANLILNDGAFYNVTNMYVGRNQGGDHVGKGLLSVDGGQMYLGGTLVIGFSGTADPEDRYALVELKSGILSATNINFGTKTGELKLEGGKFVAQKVTGDLVNVGSTVEIAAKFTPSEENVNALGDGETWYSKYQEGTAGKLTVTGTYSQTGGALALDLVSTDSYDVLTAGAFNVTGGSLQINVSDALPDLLEGGETFAIFGTDPVGTLDFATITPNFGASSQWILGADGVLTYFKADQIPEPAAWMLLLLGAALMGFSRKVKVHKS